jgi:hypothetical protein
LTFFASSNVSCQFVRHGINSDILITSLIRPSGSKGALSRVDALMVILLFYGDGLTEADVSLSAARLPKVAAAVLEPF